MLFDPPTLSDQPDAAFKSRKSFPHGQAGKAAAFIVELIQKHQAATKAAAAKARKQA